MPSSVSFRLSLAVLVGLAAGNAGAQQSYTVTDLGVGSAGAIPRGINNYGQVVGATSNTGSFYSDTSSAFLWQPSTENATTGAASYPFPAGSGAISYAYGINSMGQVIGYNSSNQGSQAQVFLFTPTVPNSAAGSLATLPIVPPAPGTNFQPAATINDSGEAVAVQGLAGGGQTSAIFSPTTPNGTTGTVTPFSGFIGDTISNSGSVAGVGSKYGATYQAERFTPSSLDGISGSTINIADPGQGGTYFTGPGSGDSINSVGDVAAIGSPAGNNINYQALLWKANGQVINIATLLGSSPSESIAYGINDADQVVGVDGANNHAFIYSSGSTYDLNNLIGSQSSNWTLNDAFGINDKGQIIGTGVHNGVSAAFIMTPNAVTNVVSQWINTGSGDWNVSENWSAGIPNAADAEADFFGAISSNQTVYTNIPITAGTLNFNNSNTYVVTGSSTLTLLASTGSAQIIVQSGTQEINLPLYVASNAVFNVSSGATLLISNPLTVISGNHVTSTGSGTVTFDSDITLQSGASLNLSGPTVIPAASLAASASLFLNPHAAGSAAILLQTRALSIVSSGTVDITNNAIDIQNGNLTAITAEAASGYDGGVWKGSGITSSTAAADSTHRTAVGVILNTNGLGDQIYGAGTGAGLFEGANPASSDVLVKFTYYGDTNLDGKVDGTDYSRIDNGFLNHLTGWFNGDFNYDGVINGSDYTLIDNAFNTQGSQLDAELAELTAQVAGASTRGNAVPEPAYMGFVCFGAVAALCRQRRFNPLLCG